jgi:hypothetical protein
MRKWLLFSFICCSLPAFAQKDSSLALTHVTIIDCTGAPAQPNSTVVVAQGHITAVGPSDAIKIPAGTRVVDATGKFLIRDFGTCTDTSPTPPKTPSRCSS